MTQKKTKPARKTSAKTSAAEVIKSALDRSRVAELNDSAIAALSEILAHNDTQSNHMRRVGAPTCIRMLQSHGWVGATPRALDKACRDQLGRTSYNQP